MTAASPPTNGADLAARLADGGVRAVFDPPLLAVLGMSFLAPPSTPEPRPAPPSTPSPTPPPTGLPPTPPAAPARPVVSPALRSILGGTSVRAVRDAVWRDDWELAAPAPGQPLHDLPASFWAGLVLPAGLLGVVRLREILLVEFTDGATAIYDRSDLGRLMGDGPDVLPVGVLGAPPRTAAAG